MQECRAPFPPHLLQGKHFTCPPGFITLDGTRASSTSALPEAGDSTAGPSGAVTSQLWGNSAGIDPAAEVWKTLCQQPPPRQSDAFPEPVTFPAPSRSL